jgi:hypothetical protein
MRSSVSGKAANPGESFARSVVQGKGAADKSAGGDPEMRTPFPIFGGKRRVAEAIWQRFGDPAFYVGEQVLELVGAVLNREPKRGSR